MIFCLPGLTIKSIYLSNYKITIQNCAGITGVRVLNEDFYAQILQMLIYLHLLTGCLMKMSSIVRTKCSSED